MFVAGQIARCMPASRRDLRSKTASLRPLAQPDLRAAAARDPVTFRGPATAPGGRRAGAYSTPRLHPEGAHPLPERVPVHAEELGGAELVPVRAGERGGDERRLHRGERRLVAAALGRRRRRASPRRARRRRAPASSASGQEADEILRRRPACPASLRSARWMTFCSSRTFPGQPCETQQRLGVLREGERPPLELLAVLREEVAREQDDVPLALAQRREPDGHHREAVVEVAPEAPLLHGAAEVRVRRGDDAHVDRRAGACRRRGRSPAPAGRAAASPAARAASRRSRRGRACRPRRARTCPGRRSTAPVKEPFSWPYSSLSMRSFGIAAMLTVTKGAAGAGRVRVDGAGDELLAGARLAHEQDRHLGARDAADLLVDLDHRRRAADERLGQRDVPVAARLGRPRRPRSLDGGLRLGVLGGRLGEVLHDPLDAGEIEGLAEVVRGAALHRLHRRAHRVLGRHHHDEGRVGAPGDLAEQREAVVAGQAHVEQHEPDAVAAGAVRAQLLARLLGAAGLDVRDADALAGLAEDEADRRLVVDDEHLAQPSTSSLSRRTCSRLSKDGASSHPRRARSPALEDPRPPRVRPAREPEPEARPRRRRGARARRGERRPRRAARLRGAALRRGPRGGAGDPAGGPRAPRPDSARRVPSAS